MNDRKCTDRLDWSDLRTFRALIEHETLSGTARALGITHATVGRRVEALELALGHRLFRRQNGRYALTAEGRKIADLAAPMEESALAIVRAAAGLKPELEGNVRVTCTEAVGAYFAMPVLGRLRERHPHIAIELIIADQKLSLARREADVALRLSAPGPDRDLISERLADVPYDFYATRTYMQQGRVQHDYLGYPVEFDNWLEAITLNSVAKNDRIVLRTNNLTNRIAAVRHGLGIGLIPCAVAATWPELVRVDTGHAPIRRELWALAHKDLSQVPRIKVCFEMLRDGLRDGGPGETVAEPGSM